MARPRLSGLDDRRRWTAQVRRLSRLHPQQPGLQALTAMLREMTEKAFVRALVEPILRVERLSASMFGAQGDTVAVRAASQQR